MKIKMMLLCCFCICCQALVQVKGQDIRKMSAAEQEAWKKKVLAEQTRKLKQLAATANIGVDELSLPGAKIEMPPKDLRRLAGIPRQTPDIQQLTAQIRLAQSRLGKMVKPELREAVTAMTATMSAEQKHTAAAGAFYAGQPEQAVLIAMQTALENPGEVMPWNNLAAIMTMSGLEHQAIPILMHQLETNPESSLLLNNMGQAYLGLGDIGMAELFLNKCLAIDPYHPEANHSMGLIRFYYDRFEEGTRYFEKELAMTYRRSTMALLRSKNKNVNLLRLRKNNQRLPGKDYFGELQLGRLRIPDFPENMDQTAAAKTAATGFQQSATREMLYWMNKTTLSDEERAADGRKNPGLYADLVEKLLEDLQVVYPGEELALFSDADINHIQLLLGNYGNQLAAVKCPVPPAGVGGEMYKAYIAQCCAMKKTVMDDFVAEYNAFVRQRINSRIPVWKDYINDMINIVSLAPNAGNRVMVYHTVENYFGLLQTAWQSGQFLDPPLECAVAMSEARADSLVELSHNLQLNCPAWLNVEVDLELLKLKADCDKYALEGGKYLQGSFEHSFKTGTSTIAAGIGVKEKLSPLNLSGELKQMAFISFDANQFIDFGILGKAATKVSGNPVNIGIGMAGGTAGGIEAGYTLGMHAGFKSYVKGTGALSGFVKAGF